MRNKRTYTYKYIGFVYKVVASCLDDTLFRKKNHTNRPWMNKKPVRFLSYLPRASQNLTHVAK